MSFWFALHRAAAAQRGGVELVLVLHVQLEALRRHAGIPDGPGAAVDLAQDVLAGRAALLDADMFEELAVEASSVPEMRRRNKGFRRERKISSTSSTRERKRSRVSRQ
jgi:hypothetical protein